MTCHLGLQVVWENKYAWFKKPCVSCAVSRREMCLDQSPQVLLRATVPGMLSCLP